jgi:hypothetical protein
MTRLRLHPGDHLVDRIGWSRMAMRAVDDDIGSLAGVHACARRIAITVDCRAAADFSGRIGISLDVRDRTERHDLGI